MSALDEIYRYHHREERRRDFALFPEERAAFFRKHLGKGKKILDIGCRDCALTKLFAEGNEVIGIDIDRGALESCAVAGIPARAVDLNAGDWGFGERTFDAAVAGEIIEHVYYPAAFLARVNALLKHGGVLVGSIPNAFSFKNRIRLLLGQKRGTPLEDPTHINHFSYREIRSLLAAAGFADILIDPLVVKRRYRLLARLAPGLVGFSLLFSCRKPERSGGQ